MGKIEGKTELLNLGKTTEKEKENFEFKIA